MNDKKKQMTENNKYFIYIRRVIPWVLVVTIMVMVGASYAAYMNQAFQRGVVRNQEQDKARFTSNYMVSYPYETESGFVSKIATYTAGDPETQLSTVVTVRNFIPDNSGAVNDHEITYTMKVVIENAQEGKRYTVNDKPLVAGADKTCTFIFKNQKLSGRSQNTNSYSVFFYSGDLNSLSITATAIPDEDSKVYTNQQRLGAVIYPCTEAGTKVFDCKGLFLDRDSGDPEQYDAYNYEVTISNGRAEVTLSWDPQYFSINPFFITKLETSDILDDKKVSEGILRFIMDQTKGNDSYIIPFYLKSDKVSEIHSKTWDELSELIEVSGIESDTQTSLEP